MNHPTALGYYLKEYPDALDDVVKHFGSNYKTIFDFWAYVDTLDRNLIQRIQKSHYPYGLETYASKRVHRQLVVWRCARYFGSEPDKTQDVNPHVLGYATLELVVMDRLLDDGHSLTFLPLFNIL
jgi:hypothetical protein